MAEELTLDDFGPAPEASKVELSLDDFDAPKEETSALGALGRGFFPSILPAAGAGFGFALGFPLGVPAAPATYGVAPFLSGGVGAVGGGMLTHKAQDMALDAIAPEKAVRLRELQAADALQHPWASAIGRIAAGAPSFALAPGSILKGAPALVKLARGKAISEAERQAATGTATQVGAQTGLTLAPPLVLEGRIPTLAEGAEAAANALLYGAPRSRFMTPIVPRGEVPTGKRPPVIEQPPEALAKEADAQVAETGVPKSGTEVSASETVAAEGPQDASLVDLQSSVGLPIHERVKQAEPIDATPASQSALVTGLKQVPEVWRQISSVSKFTEFRETLNKWIRSLQASSIEVRNRMKEFETAIKDPKRREAVSNWIEADGNQDVLRERASTHKVKSLRKGYEDAAALSPDEIKMADGVKSLLAQKLTELQNEGILGEGVENYINHIWKRGMFESDGGRVAQFAGRLASKFKFANKRVFPTFFEGEQLGFKPLTKDFSKLVGLYISEANKVLATRKLIADMTTKKASDGRPLAYPEGAGEVIPSTEEGTPGRVLTFSNAKPADYSDYKNDGIAEPALTKWKWLAEDDAKQPVMMRGNLAFHPEIYQHMKAVFGRSAISEWYNSPGTPVTRAGKLTAKFLDESNKTVKATMLSGFISPFHAVQEGTHAIGHRINPFMDLPVLNEKDPSQIRAMEHSLMLSGDRVSMEHFVEGMNSHNLLSKVPGLGKVSNDFSSWLFERYIPALKLKTYYAIRERNLSRYDKEIKAGSQTVDDVEYLSAQQANHAYGHMNYADMGRDPTIQHILRLSMLAPDFFEARAKFAKEAAQGLGAKSGREQMEAMAFLAATFWVGARILNKLGDDDYHWDHPFSVIHGNREYAMRSVPEDIFKAYKDSRRFISGRVSPLIGAGLLEGVFGMNYRGEKVTKSEALQDAMVNVVPLSLRTAPGVRQLVDHFSTTQKNRTVSPWEQFLGTAGLHVSRYSPITQTYKNAIAWKEKNGIDKDKGVYPISKYQQLRYALEDGDFDRASGEVETLKASGMSRHKINLGFAESINHPFTGSKANDEKMKKSFPQKERALFDEAVERRKVILKRFRSVK